MKQIPDIHATITQEIKETIAPMKVVFPAHYSELYNRVALSKEVHLKPEELVNSDMLDEKMMQHIITLSECTDEAINAIENEDKTLLNNILIKSKKLQEEVNELQKMIYEDALTKSYNRKWFEDKLLDEEKLKFRENGVIVMIDVNKFKVINDTYGHNIGDKVLIKISQMLKQVNEKVVRYGGDEFIIVFDDNLSLQQIEAKLKNLLQYFQKTHFRAANNDFKVSFSYGMASFANGASFEQTIEVADQFMYANKRATRE